MKEINSSDFQKNVYHWMRQALQGEDVIVNHKSLGKFRLETLKSDRHPRLGGGENDITLKPGAFERWSEELSEMFDVS